MPSLANSFSHAAGQERRQRAQSSSSVAAMAALLSPDGAAVSATVCPPRCAALQCVQAAPSRGVIAARTGDLPLTAQRLPVCARACGAARLCVQRRWAGSRSHVYLPDLGDSPPAAVNIDGNSVRVSCSPCRNMDSVPSQWNLLQTPTHPWQDHSDHESAAWSPLRSAGAGVAPGRASWDEELAGLKQEMEYDVQRILSSGRKSCRHTFFSS